MNSLPASIEAYLKEAGFSLTEIIALKHLLEEDALTLRQLAAKTGKSTGVLDQAMRKLLEKNIVTKEPINENPKYVLRSLDAITGWMERDMQVRKTEMQQRYKNFETFIASVQTGRNRPEMEYFEGLEGLSQAYRKLLDRVPLAPKAKGFFQPTARGEMLHEFPVVCSVEDDPLREFRVQEFRERRSRGVFARYLIPATPLGRRFESRDPFEYHQSILMPEEEHPITFEKVIAGDTVGCFNHAEKRACFIRFPEFAQSERQSFERTWKAATAANSKSQIPAEGPEGLGPERESIVPTPTPSPTPNPISVSIRTFSGLREFFLSRASLAFMGIFALIAAALTYGLYRQNVYLNTQRIRERAMSIASTAALQFDPADLEKIRTWKDMSKPTHKKIVRKLQEIREQNPGVIYAYIFRPLEDEHFYEFIADADPPTAELTDTNGDGILNDQVQPGYLWLDDDPGESAVFRARTSAAADKKPVTDPWGIWLSGHAPIRASDNSSAGILGIDFQQKDVYSMTKIVFKPLITFFGIFFLLTLVRLAAFNIFSLKDLHGIFHKVRG